MAARDTNFYYSFLALPETKRQAIVAVWDFCRAVDDAVDEAVEPAGAEHARAHAVERIVGWRQELAACYEAEDPTTPQGRQLKPFVERFHLPRQAFEDLIDGVAMDVEHRRYATFNDLYAYCLRVASAVGLVCVEIFGYRDRRCRDYAIALGVALQLTNILRDISSDLARDRLYLPLEDLDRFACTEEDLRLGRLTPAVRALLAFECRRAEDYYRRADLMLPRVDARRLVAARIMAAIYHQILRLIEARGYDVFSNVARVSRPRKALIAGLTWAKTMAGL